MEELKDFLDKMKSELPNNVFIIGLKDELKEEYSDEERSLIEKYLKEAEGE